MQCGARAMSICIRHTYSHLAQQIAVGPPQPGLHRAPLTTRLRARLAVQRQRVIVGVATTTKPVEP